MADVRDEFSPARVGVLSEVLSGVWHGFDAETFGRGIAGDLAPATLTGRMAIVADRLARVLPANFPEAAAVLTSALDDDRFTGWITVPCGRYVAERGLDHPDVALSLLERLTPRFSSEFAIRTFIEHRPSVTFEHLDRWTRHEDEHVRRLVSEGTRPRLPWASRLRTLMADPTPVVRLLDRLYDDPSAYVRRSVANHLNDIAKDHPEVALDCARRWLPVSAEAAWVVRHGLRTMVKNGHPEALVLLGVAPDAPIVVTSFAVHPDIVPIGGEIEFLATLVLDAEAPPSDAVIDYRVHYMGASALKAPKVFKLTRRALEPGQPVEIVRRHRFEHVSIRRINPGRHVVDLQVNGRVLGTAELMVVDRAPIGDVSTSWPEG